MARLILQTVLVIGWLSVFECAPAYVGPDLPPVAPANPKQTDITPTPTSTDSNAKQEYPKSGDSKTRYSRTTIKEKDNSEESTHPLHEVSSYTKTGTDKPSDDSKENLKRPARSTYDKEESTTEQKPKSPNPLGKPASPSLYKSTSDEGVRQLRSAVDPAPAYATSYQSKQEQNSTPTTTTDSTTAKSNYGRHARATDQTNSEKPQHTYTGQKQDGDEGQIPGVVPTSPTHKYGKPTST